MEEKIKLIKSSLGAQRVKLNENLSYHTFSKIGGPAECFYMATEKKELIGALDVCHQLKVPYFVLGGGTKVLISDKGIRGMVIKNKTGKIKIGSFKGRVGRDGLGIEEAVVEVDSGVLISKLNEFLRSTSLQEVVGVSSGHSSVGSCVFIDPYLQALTQKITVWDKGEIKEISMPEIDRISSVVLTLFVKAKARNG